VLGFDYLIVLITSIVGVITSTVGAASCRDSTVLRDILKKAISRLEAAPTEKVWHSHKRCRSHI